MEEKETIRRLYFNQRHSIREIAKERGHSRKTVKKAISDASVPEYHLTKTRPSPIMDPFKAIIGQWLEEDRFHPPNSVTPLTVYIPGW